MKVVATAVGLYPAGATGRKRAVGEAFELEDAKHFSKRWMRKAGDKETEQEVKARNLTRKEEIAAEAAQVEASNKVETKNSATSGVTPGKPRRGTRKAK